MKRLICLMPGVFLAAALLGGAGEAVPIEIWNLQALDGIRHHLGGDYVLMRDLDFNDADGYDQNDPDWAAKKTAWTDGAGWVPIGRDFLSFTGTFNGNGRTISGLFMNRPGMVWPDMEVGLFGQVSPAGTVKNAGLLDVDITGSERVGGLVGDNRGTVSNSYAAGSITGNNRVGGLVGDNSGTVSSDSYAVGSITGVFGTGGLVGRNCGRVANSYADGSVSGADFTGGLVGWNLEEAIWNFEGTVINSHAAGSVTGTQFSTGGLVGDNRGTVSDSYASGSVSGSSYIGGLVGDNTGGLVANSYASGSVSGWGSFIGGLAGRNRLDVTIHNSYASGSVSGDFGVGGLVGTNLGGIFYSYSTGRVTGNTNVGGLIGSNTGTVEDSFYDSETSGRSDIGKGEPRDTAQMKDIATFAGAGWDIQASGTDLNDGYPYLGWQSGGNPPVWNIYDASWRPPRGGGGPRSGPVSPPGSGWPPPPGGFGVSPLEGLPFTNRLWWDEAAGGRISKYHLYVSTEWAAGAAAEAMDAAGLMFRLLDEVPGDVFEYMHAGLTPGIKYYYVIVSADEDGVESRVTSNLLWAVAGTGETGEYDPISWGAGRITDGAGSLSVTITPSAVRAAAGWRRVGTDAWLESGHEEADVPAGPHVVEFNEVAGWEKPADIRVSVNPGIAMRVTGAYLIGTDAPGLVELISPEGTQERLVLTYSWKPAPGATWYRLWINRGGVNTWDSWYKVGEEVFSRDEVVAVELPGHRPGADYEWWIQAWSPNGRGPWSDVMRFNTRGDVPGKIKLVAPAGGQGDLKITYYWEHDAKSTWYRLWINRGGVNTWDRWYKVGGDVFPLDGIVAVELPGHRPGVGYEWWVQGWNPFGSGPWSDIMRFDTGAGQRLERGGLVGGGVVSRVFEPGMKVFP